MALAATASTQNLSRTTNLPPTSHFYTVMGWVRLDTDPNSDSYCFALGNAPRYLLGVALDGTSIRLFNGTANADGAYQFTLGRWTHIALVVTSSAAGGAVVYADGVPVLATATTAGSIVFGTLRLFDYTSGTGDFWPGSIAGVKVWNRPLDVSEIRQEMMQLAPVNARGINSVYPLSTNADVTDHGPHRYAALTKAAGTLVDVTGPAVPLRQARRRTVRSSGAGGNFTLDAQPGAFVVTGEAAGVLKGSRLDAQPGAFVLAGEAAALLKGSRLDAEFGTFALAGVDAALNHGTPGNFTLVAQPGAFVVTGEAAGVLKGSRLDAQPGTFALAGEVAALLKGSRLDAEFGMFALAGQAATLSATGQVPPEADVDIVVPFDRSAIVVPFDRAEIVIPKG